MKTYFLSCINGTVEVKYSIKYLYFVFLSNAVDFLKMYHDCHLLVRFIGNYNITDYVY